MRKRRSSWKFLWCATLGIVGGTALWAAPPVWEKQLQFTSEAVRGEGSAVEVYRIKFNDSIYRYSQPHYGDVRILAPDGKNVAFAVRQRRRLLGQTVTKTVNTKVTRFEQCEDRAIVEFEVPEKIPLQAFTGIKIDVAQNNFEKRVTIWSVDEAGSVRLLADYQPFFDYSETIDLVKDRIAFDGPSPARHYRMFIDNFSEQEYAPEKWIVSKMDGGEEQYRHLLTKTLKIKSIQLTYEQPTDEFLPEREKYPLKLVEQQVNPANGNTVMIFESSREPLTELMLSTYETNFLRRIHLAAGDTPEEFRHLVSGRFCRIQSGAIQVNESKLTFPEQRSRYYRLIIVNEDNAPLENVTVSAYGNVYDACLLPPQPESLQVFFGGTLKSPNYDVLAVLKSLRAPATADYTLGPISDNPNYEPSLLAQGKKDLSWLLPLAIAVMVFGLAWILYCCLRRINDKDEFDR